MMDLNILCIVFTAAFFVNIHHKAQLATMHFAARDSE